MGWTLIPNNLALLGTWYIIATKGTVNTSYPVVNLNDWNHINQTWITSQSVSGTWTVLLKCVLPNATLVSDWDVSGVGLVNGTIGGLTCDVLSKTSDSNDATDNSGSATSRASLSMDNSVGNPNALYSFSAVQAIGWYIRFTANSSFVLKLGNVVLGKAFDLGYPRRPESFQYQPKAGLRTETGVSIMPRIIEPDGVRNLTFEDATYVVSTTVYDRTTDNSDHPNYFSLVKAFETARPLAIAGGYPTYTGISAGAGIPIVYHEGSANGLSTMGRPAFYGVWTLQMNRNSYRTISPLTFSIVDAVPKGTNIMPVQ